MKSLISLIHPGFLMGFRFSDWLRLLLRHGFDPFYLPRVLLTTPLTLVSSMLALVDRALMSAAKVDERLWKTPVFLLGLPRSGTTQLLYLLSQHPKLVAPIRLEAYNPSSFMLMRRLGINRWKIFGKTSDRRIDKVEVGWNLPEQDDFGIFALTGIRGCLWRTFPNENSPLAAGEYFSSETQGLAQAWKQALSNFTRKLVATHQSRLILKSPSHTTKIPEILEVFPEAKFVTIFREPMAHFQSFRAALERPGTGWGELRKRPHLDNEMLLETVSRQLRRYFYTRHLIPEENLMEIRHEDLNDDPVRELSNVTQQIGIAGSDRFFQHLSSRWDVCYRKNKYPSLPDDLKSRIRQAYAPLYERGIYI